MPQLSQKELDAKASIVPDQWMEPPELRDWHYEPIPNDEEIKDGLRKQIKAGDLEYLARKLETTDRALKIWASAKKKTFSASEWRRLQPEINIQRELILTSEAESKFAEYKASKEKILAAGIGWNSDRLGLEAYEALSHYLSRYYHRIAVQKIADQIGIPVALIRWQTGTISPDTIVGRDAKERIRKVCNETWPDRYQMLEIYRDYFSKHDDHTQQTKEIPTIKQTDQVPRKQIEQTPAQTPQTPPGCSTALFIIVGVGLVVYLL